MKQIASMKIFLWVLKVGCTSTLIIFPAVMIYGAFSTGQPASSILSNYAPETPILVSFSINGDHHVEGGKVHDDRFEERGYILFPSIFRQHQIMFIKQTADGTIIITRDKYRLFYLGAWYLLCLIVTGLLWLKPGIKVVSKNEPQ
jgi:hypothetical protein